MGLIKQQQIRTAPLKIYGIQNIEPVALNQFYEAMKLECVVKGALMADAHCGYTLPIGGVVATRDIIFPSFVGYDIGCGMSAIKTNYTKHMIEKNSQDIFSSIYRSIPCGLGKHNNVSETWDYSNIQRSEFLDEIISKNPNDLCSLGSGNHFIEIGYDNINPDETWIIIHSGSRGIGYKTATNWMKIASESDKDKEGFYGLESGSDDGLLYMMDMEFCLLFALENRKLMIERVIKQIEYYCNGNDNMVDWNSLINRNHNHAEYNYDLDAFIHRKGATHSEKDMLGIIPGNMKDGSFIVKGKGNPDSLCSSSHGAGRVLGRNVAKRELKLDKFKNDMEGITAKVSKDTLDESPLAYKDIFEVIKLQSDLIEVVKHIKPILNIKG